MKVIPEIIELAKEHHKSLVLANKCINLHKNQDKDLILELCEHITKSFHQDWEKHFATEETFIFTPLIEESTSLKAVSEQLINEHKKLLSLASRLHTETNLLVEFGLLLRSHTRTEDRMLFPYLEDHLTKKQLELITINIKN